MAEASKPPYIIWFSFLGMPFKFYTLFVNKKKGLFFIALGLSIGFPKISNYSSFKENFPVFFFFHILVTKCIVRFSTQDKKRKRTNPEHPLL